MRGYIRKRGDSYRVEIHIGVGPDGKRVRHSKTLPNKKAAEKYLRQKLDELETEGGIRVRSVETLEQFLTRWLQVCSSQRVRQRTFEEYVATVNRYVTGTAFGRQGLATVQPADIQQRYFDLTAAGVGPHAVRKLHAVIRQALQQAVRWRELSVNPALSVDLPKVKRNRELKVIPVEAFPAFTRSALQEPRLAALWIVALATGMRPEEFLGLVWDDLSESGRRVTINRVLVHATKVVPGEPRWRLEPPKTEKSRRTLVLDAEVAFLLKQHRAAQSVEKLRAGEAYQDNGFIFCNEVGGPLDLSNLRRTLRRILRRAGLPETLTTYSLRHSAATALLKDRESLKVVSELLGHSTIRLTADVYSHVADDMLEEAAGKLSRRMFG